MGNSCDKGAAGLDSSNAIPSPEQQNTFKWTIDGFSSLLDKDQGWTYSNIFEIMGIKWYLELNPKYKKIIGEKEFVSLRLELPRGSLKLDTIVEASFKFIIYDQSNGEHKEQLVDHRFRTASTSSGIACMLSLKTLNKQYSRFLVNNSCIFGIEFIKVATIKANTTLETLFVKKLNVFNEAKICSWNLRSNATPSPGEQTTFKWIVDGFSSLLDKDQGWTYSNIFEIMGVKWYLKLNPKYKKIIGKEEYVSLRLELPQGSVKLDTIIEASFKFMIYDQSNGKHKEQLVNHSFQTASTSSGISFMLSLKTLNKESSRFLVNNSCIFGIEFITVATIKANTALETLFVRKMNVFNEAKVYTWEIEDFFALKNRSYSPEFEIGGYTWCIHMYPSTNGNHLSLCLEMKKTNDLRKDFGNLVELSLSIKNQENGKDRKLTGRCQFSNQYPSWGWDKFISLKYFKDTTKGYLIKGKCCVVAEVAINGSSKTEYSQEFVSHN